MIPVALQTTVSYRGLERAQQVLSRSLRDGLMTLGSAIQASVRSRVRFYKGKEKGSVQRAVRGRGLNLVLTVYSLLVQAIVDEYGLPAGTFPPHRKGSRIYRWASDKKLQDKTEASERYSYRKRKRPRILTHTPPSVESRNFRAKVRRGKGDAKPAAAPKSKAVKAARRRERAIEASAYLIARNIYEKGIKPTHPFSKGLAANRNRVIHEISGAVRRAVAQINRGG